MSNHRPPPHSPLKAMTTKVALMVGIPLVIVGFVVLFSNLQTTVQDEANRSVRKLDLRIDEQNKRSLQGLK